MLVTSLYGMNVDFRALAGKEGGGERRGTRMHVEEVTRRRAHSRRDLCVKGCYFGREDSAVPAGLVDFIFVFSNRSTPRHSCAQKLVACGSLSMFLSARGLKAGVSVSGLQWRGLDSVRGQALCCGSRARWIPPHRAPRGVGARPESPLGVAETERQNEIGWRDMVYDIRGVNSAAVGRECRYVLCRSTLEGAQQSRILFDGVANQGGTDGRESLCKPPVGYGSNHYRLDA
jgi:hypothetical protein